MKRKKAGSNKRDADSTLADTPIEKQSASAEDPAKPDLHPDRDRLPIFWIAMLAMVALWLSTAPVGWFWLAWTAPWPLIFLVIRPRLGCAIAKQGSKHSQADQPRFDQPASTRRAYWMLYLCGLLYWLATFYFIPIPHPALWGGWLAVSLYMAVYTPMTVGISRMMVHQFRIPAILAVPITWTGVEWIRCHFATGMAMVCLSHTQFEYPMLIQVADLFGAYTLTFLMVMFATGVALVWYRRAVNLATSVDDDQARRYSAIEFVTPLVVSLAALAFTFGYGFYRLGQHPVANGDGEESLKVALVQTSFDVVFANLTDKEVEQRIEATTSLTKTAIENHPDLKLIVWPEGSLHHPFYDVLSGDRVHESSQMIAGYWRLATTTDRSNSVPLLAGPLSYDADKDEKYNAAVLLDGQGVIVDRYFKRHLVMFGEYVPLADEVPLIQSMSPIKNFSVGKEFRAFDLTGFRIAPSICFETTVPHLIRDQLNSLEQDENIGDVDMMINITNDGWFYGTSCLDMHLACNVFRAVENRKHHLVCANTGLSASIDTAGRLLEKGPRREAGVLVCNVPKRKTTSLYRSTGALLPMLFGYLVVGLLLFGIFAGWRSR